MNKLIVSPSPHDENYVKTTNIMLNVIIALMPALIVGCVYFGWRALVLTAVCVGSCIFFEYASRKMMKRSNTIGDLSAVVTGVLLAMNLPVTLPYWIAVVGSFVAIVIVKQLFGGIGQNFANPAITARIVLMVSFPSAMTHWILPNTYDYGADAVSSATPLVLRTMSSDKLADIGQEVPSYLDLFIGKTGGCLGETCALALLIGGVYLAAGGVFLGAFFMATDYATTPITEKGKVVFGLGCGIITFIIRHFGSYPEGVSFSILLMNVLTPYIEQLTRTKVFGAKEAEKNER